VIFPAPVLQTVGVGPIDVSFSRKALLISVAYAGIAAKPLAGTHGLNVHSGDG
jgi:hypothetical protein